MGTGGRLIAGSHNRNEFVLIKADETARIKSVKELSGQTCQICGDEIEISENGEPFVACNECAFPVCRPCYEYERREGNQACPQCKTRYKRIKGSPMVLVFDLLGGKERSVAACVSKKWLMLLTSIRKSEICKSEDKEVEAAVADDVEMVSCEEDGDGFLSRCLDGKKASDLRLAALQKRLENIENDLKAAGLRESEVSQYAGSCRSYWWCSDN